MPQGVERTAAHRGRDFRKRFRRGPPCRKIQFIAAASRPSHFKVPGLAGAKAHHPAAPIARQQHMAGRKRGMPAKHRSETHPSELQSLMRTSYALFCLKKKTNI